MSRLAHAGIVAIALAVVCARAASPIRVMLLDGESAGSYHKWRATTPLLKKELDETGLFAVEVVTAPPAGADFSSFTPGIQPIPGGRAQLRRAGRAMACLAQDVV